MKYFADLSLKRTVNNPLQIVILTEDNKMYSINANKPEWFDNRILLLKYNFGEDELVEITKEYANQILISWGAEALK